MPKVMPLELWIKVVSFLPVTDTQSLQEAARDADLWDAGLWDADTRSLVLTACDNRLSVENYFAVNLGSGRGILEAMSRNLVYLSGSRSLEFHFPGYADDNSDWDMYAGARNAASFMTDMENKAGVRWLTPTDRIIDCIKRGAGTTTMSIDVYKALIESHGLEGVIRNVCRREFGKEVVNIDVESAFSLPQALRCVYVVVKDKAVQIVSGSDDYWDGDGIFTVIYGKLRYKAIYHDIQLIVEREDYALPKMTSLFRYHSTCVQSFVTAHVSGHAYGDLTGKGLAMIWSDNAKTEREKQAVKKYESRGFEMENSMSRTEYESEFNIRKITDKESTLLIHEDHVGPTQVHKGVVADICKMSWFETRFKARQGSPPPGVYNDIDGMLHYNSGDHESEVVRAWLRSGSTYNHVTMDAWVHPRRTH